MRVRGLFVILVLIVLVAAPAAVALDGCLGTSSACGLPCSAPCASVSAPVSEPILMQLATLAPPTIAHVPAVAPKTLDAPPKSLLLA